ncbi:MAG TPA: TlyA family RNA methyltransferase [Candidatus Paceibacterota bacterium]
MKIRLDTLLPKLNLARSRSEARDLIDRGHVYVNSVQVKKASKEYEETIDPALIEIKVEQYVGRGAYKLEEALQKFNISAQGRNALDIGSSTGGFTEVLLKHGAETVHAVDVGKDQLAQALRKDPRVISLEETDIRELPSIVPKASLVVIDVSFISLGYIFPHLSRFTARDGAQPVDVIALIKPQFEVSKGKLNKSGIVKGEADAKATIATVASSAAESGFQLVQTTESPIEGGSGNREFLGHFKMTVQPRA